MCSQARSEKGFDFRVVLGCWTNDVSSVPKFEQWPSMHMDELLERDLAEFFDFMREVGLEYIVLCGLLVSHDWHADFAATVPHQRQQAVKRILDAAHKRGVKILYGLGLYSWGFDEIIKTNPGVRGTNPSAMCAARSESHRVMNSLVDYLMDEYSFDGFHFESADQGRCSCDKCKPMTDSEYHLELNRQVAEHVRSRRPDMPIEVYCPIRRSVMDDWLIWEDASGLFTAFIDDCNFADRFGCSSRREVISRFKCAYGTRSGRWTYPPQQWRRDRWFVPIIDLRAEHYRRLAADGGRAVMIQGMPLANPGEEATLRCSGKLATDPSRSGSSVLLETVEEMFRPDGDAAARQIADIFWAAEKAFWCNAHFTTDCGELQIQPLHGTVAGPPVYLESHMFWHDLANYQHAMKDISRRYAAVRGNLADRGRADRLAVCIDSTLKDVARCLDSGKFLTYPVTALTEDTWTIERIW